MKLNLFSRTFAALLSGLTLDVRQTAIPPYRHGKTGISAAKRRARKSNNRLRQRHGRA